MNLFVFFFFTNLFIVVSKNITTTVKNIELDENNILILKGEINNKLASQFILELNKKDQKKILLFQAKDVI